MLSPIWFPHEGGAIVLSFRFFPRREKTQLRTLTLSRPFFLQFSRRERALLFLVSVGPAVSLGLLSGGQRVVEAQRVQLGDRNFCLLQCL